MMPRPISSHHSAPPPQRLGQSAIAATAPAATPARPAKPTEPRRVFEALKAAKVPVGERFNARLESRAIQDALVHGKDNRWSALRLIHQPEDFKRLQAIVADLVADPAERDQAVVHFYRHALRSRIDMPRDVFDMLQSLPQNWARRPSAYLYPDQTGTKDGFSKSTWYELADTVEKYFGETTPDGRRAFNLKNIYTLPTGLEGPRADEGFDPLLVKTERGYRFVAAREMGGDEGFEHFLRRSVKLGFANVHDVITHVSNQSELGQRALAGDPEALSYFITLPRGTKYAGRVERDGLPRVALEHPDGTVSHPWDVFEHENSTHMVPAGKDDHILTLFYEFQLPLNHRRAKVQDIFFGQLGEYANLGLVGLRMDAAPHWDFEMGTGGLHGKGAHRIQELYNLFWGTVVPDRGILLPEVGFEYEVANTYRGEPSSLNGTPTMSQGAALLNFAGHGALIEAAFTGNATPLRHHIDELNAHGVAEDRFTANFSGHHDEARHDMASTPEVRQHIEHEALANGGYLFGGGRGLGGRLRTMLGNDPQRLLNAEFSRHQIPGMPLSWVGTAVEDVGTRPDYMVSKRRERFRAMAQAGLQPTWEAAKDYRDPGRGPVSQAQLDRALSSNDAVMKFETLNNDLWYRIPALQSISVQPVDAGNENVSAIVRGAGEPSSLLALRNLAAQPRTARVSLAAAQELLGWQPSGPECELVDLLGADLSGEKRAVIARVRGEHLEIELPPHETMYLERPR